MNSQTKGFLNSRFFKLIIFAVAFLGFLAFSCVYLKDFDYVMSLKRLPVLALMAALPMLCVGVYFYFVKKINTSTFVFILLAMACVMAIRLSMLDYLSSDYIVCLEPWTTALRRPNGFSGLQEDFANYNMPYLYVLALIGKTNLHQLYPIKFFSIYFDFFAAYYIMRISAFFFKSIQKQIAVFFAVLLFPTVILNSAYWAQCDAVYAAFAVGAVYYGLTKRSRLCFIMLALAIAFKLQAVFIIPFIIVLLFTKRIKLKALLYLPVTFFLTLVPALLAGKPFMDTISIYYNQANQYPSFSMNAPSVYFFLNIDYVFDLKLMNYATVFLAGAAILLVLYYCWLKRSCFDTKALLLLAFFFSLLVPFLLPRMHERYFYMAELLSVIPLLLSRRRLFIPLIMLYVTCRTYSVVLFSDSTVNRQWLAIMLIIVLLVTAWDIVKRLKSNSAVLKEAKKFE
ncbi:MAG: hypothetical protein LBS74_04255 [Oscillospiraceae bacterium]|jgi:Gpi18-like mannosyltransferase|nr:hypothetical protein [Oscillospiraceae bacterium]